jgi:histidyl-tRNA synthetase
VEGQIQIEQFQRYLSNYKNYPIIFDPSIVRGLDYYTGMVFEAEVLLNVKNKKGQDVIFGSVAGGGRYDKLIARFGKEDVPATGISIGVDRLIVAMQQKKLLEINPPPLVVIANMDNNQLSEYLKMADELRDVGIACEVSYGSKNLAKQLKYCDRKKANIVVIAGDSEIENGVVSIKDLAAGKELSKKITEREEWKESKAGQFEVKRKEFIRAIKKILDKQ